MATPAATTDSTAASSPAETQVQAPEVVQAPDVEFPEGVKDEKSKARFVELVNQAKEAKAALEGYQKFGSAEELEAFVQGYQELAAEHEQLKGQVAALQKAREPGEPKSDEQKTLEAQEKAAREQLRKLLPSLDKMDQFLEREERERAIKAEVLREDAVSETQAVMAEYGFSTKPAEVAEMCDILEPIIKRDPRLAYRFEREPGKVIKTAMDRLVAKTKESLSRTAAAEAQRSKEKTAALPRAHGGGGGPAPPIKGGEQPKTVTEGVAQAMARFREQNRG